MGHRFIESMRKNEFDLPQKTWKKNHQNRAEKYSDRNNTYSVSHNRTRSSKNLSRIEKIRASKC